MNIKFLLVFLLLLPLISANGLIVNQSFIVNKTIDNNVNIVFTIVNGDNKDFYNITSDNNDIISFAKFDLLNGQSKNITAIVKTNSNFNGIINILGFYYINIGKSNETKNINVMWNNASSYIATPCISSIVEGGYIKWNNFGSMEFGIKNSQTQENICSSVLPSGNCIQKYDTPMVLNYYFTMPGTGEAQFSNICTVNVLSGSGYINDPVLNGKLNISVNVTYEPTTMSTTFLVTNYSINVYDTDEGQFLIKNIGTKIAKNIHITGDWFSFYDVNGKLLDFDLIPNSSKVITYKINPIVAKTNDTGKNYEKNILISGNFVNLNQRIDVFVNYADIDSGNYSSGDSIISILARYCVDNPNVNFCKTNPTVIFKNGSDGENMTQEQFRIILAYWATKFMGVDDFMTWQKESTNNQSNNINNVTNDVKQLRIDVENIKAENQGTTSMVYFIVLGICIFVIVAGGSWVIWYLKRQRKNMELKRW